ncbi:hypothetical protein VDGL01_10206 [Verticillium dahliae]
MYRARSNRQQARELPGRENNSSGQDDKGPSPPSPPGPSPLLDRAMERRCVDVMGRLWSPLLADAEVFLLSHSNDDEVVRVSVSVAEVERMGLMPVPPPAPASPPDRQPAGRLDWIRDEAIDKRRAARGRPG